MKRIPFLPILWILALGAFIFFTLRFQQPSSSFWGVVQSEKTVIRSPEAGEIRMLRVKTGDAVAPGDTLLVLFQPEIDRQQTDHSLQLRQVKDVRQAKIRELNMKIRSLEIDWESARAKVLQARRLWEAQQARDSLLALPWLQGDSALNTVDSVLLMRRNAFASQLSYIDREYPQRIGMLRQELVSLQQEDPVDQKMVENDLAYWEEIGHRQVIRAPQAGWVGEVMVSETELCLKGVSLVEIWSLQASYVEGYIHETFSATLEAGQTLKLTSPTETQRHSDATLIRLGNRIVEFPDRLRKAPDIPMWGREAIIHLPEGNPFLIGEKVLIQVP